MFQWLSAISITAHRMSGPKIETGMRLSRSIALPHPGDEQGKLARGLEACGSEAIRKDGLNGAILTLSVSLFACLLLWMMARRSMTMRKMCT
jgi:hypothetical protein